MNIQRKKFRYSLMKDDATYYYVAGGAALTSNVQIPLSKDPVEWKETDLQWKRSDKYHGVFRSFVVPLTFIKDGAAILRHVYYTEGVEGHCILKIERLNHTTQQYELYYIGDIDFSRTQDTKNTFQVAVLDRGLAALLKAKESTAYELPMLRSSCLSVLMDGMTLRGNAHYVVAEQGILAPVTISNTALIAQGGAEGLNEATLTDTSYQPAPATIDLTHGAVYTAKFAETVTVSMSFTIEVDWPSSVSNARTFAVGIRSGPIGGTVVNGYLYVAPYALAPGQSGTFTVTTANKYTVSLNAGDSVGIFLLMIDIPTLGGIYSSINSRYRIRGSEGYLDIYTEYRRPATSVLFKRQANVWQELISKMSDGAYGVISSYLTNPTAKYEGNSPWNTLMTCGDAVRGLGDASGAVNTTPAKMKVTVDDLLQDALGRSMCGVGVEGNNVRIERLDYFYRNDMTVADLGEVNNLQVSPATDYIWNTLKIGYKYQEHDKLNGKDDPFLTHQYASAGIRVKAERDATSPFVASVVTQEYIRANLGGKKTTDSGSDNDICLAEISGQQNGPFGTFTLARQQNDPGGAIQNMLAGSTAYNLSLTPKRNLYRNAPFIATALHLLNADLTFQTADQNADLISKLGSLAAVVEKADVPVNSLGSPLFLPIIFTFETQVPTDIAALIDAQPYGKIAFICRGKSFSGFILEAGIKPADNAIYTYKLLAAPDTNLSNLIR